MRKKVQLLIFVFAAFGCFAQITRTDTLQRYKDGNYLLKKGDRLFLSKQQQDTSLYWEWMYSGKKLTENLLLVQRSAKDSSYTSHEKRSYSYYATFKEGVLNVKTGEVIVPCQFTNIKLLHKNAIKYERRIWDKPPLSGLVSLDGTHHFPPVYKRIDLNGKNYLLFTCDTLVFVNQALERTNTLAQVSNYQVFRSGNYVDVAYNDLHGLADKNGKLLLEKRWRSIMELDSTHNVVAQNQDGKYDLYDPLTGHNLSRMSFDRSFGHTGNPVFYKGPNFYIYNQQGKLLLNSPGELQTLPVSGDGRFSNYFYTSNGLTGIVSTEGRIVKKPVYEAIEIVPGKDYFKGKSKAPGNCMTLTAM